MKQHCLHPDGRYVFCCWCGLLFSGEPGAERNGHGPYAAENMRLNAVPAECFGRWSPSQNQANEKEKK